MPRTKRPDVFQLAVATRSYSSVDGYRKEIDVLKNELAQTRQRLDDQARDFAREREDLQRQLRVKKGAPASPEKPVVVKKDDNEAQRWEARCAALAAQRVYTTRRVHWTNGAREYASKVASEQRRTTRSGRIQTSARCATAASAPPPAAGKQRERSGDATTRAEPSGASARRRAAH